MERRRVELPLAIVAVVACAGAATLLLRPRGELIQPAAVEAKAYFSPAEIERGKDFAGPARWLGLGAELASVGALGFLAVRPPRRIRRALDRAGGRPVVGAAAAGAGIAVVLAVVGLPFGAVSHQRAVDFGLSTQDWGGWLTDEGKGAGISLVLSGLLAAIALALIRRFPRRWWVPGTGAVVVLAALMTFLGPVVLDPIFNKFDPLPAGSRLRGEVIGLARKAGVDVGEVYRVDASIRTTGANAYVNGLGKTKRVVLYDNLIEKFPPAETRSVVAHELAHAKYDDVPRGILWLAIVAPAAVFLIQRGSERLVEPGERGLPRSLPALALVLGVVSFGVGIASNDLSRRVEARADAFALEETKDPKAFIGLERRLAVQNVSDPDPPAVWHALFGTHPTALERIGYGLAYERR